LNQRIEFQTGPMAGWQADAVIFFAFEDEDKPLPGLAKWLEQTQTLSGERLLADLKGKQGRTVMGYAPETAPRLVLVGLGPRDKFDLNRLREAAATAVRVCREVGAAVAGLPLAALQDLGEDGTRFAEEAVVGTLLGLYEFRPYKTEDKKPPRLDALLLLCEEEPAAEVRQASERAQAVVSGVCLARDLINEPSNTATPSYMADVARDMGARYGFQVTVLEQEEIVAQGMGAFAAVFQGSDEPARLAIIDTGPVAARQEKPLVFVGKGVTFDTGGISLKPSLGMGDMKGDMGGAAAVLGCLEALGRQKSTERVVGVLPLTDNVPGSRAIKPGDIVTALSGKTVEIINTDAEGRLLLIDALTYARRFDPLAMVDLATLTGACVVALGPKVAGAFGNRDQFVRRIHEIGLEAGDRIWPMPLWDFYLEDMKSNFADIKNTGPREGGAINAAIFLNEFVPEEIPWVHIDIAGPSFGDKKTPLCPPGGTGFGVRTLLELVRRRGELGLE
jgi:leucyl aminopeptidase